jgi:COP9 signalosome complex subunit 5
MSQANVKDDAMATDDPAPPAPSPDDARYFYDEAALQEVKKAKPWMKDPKHFKKVAISPSAIIKIMMHCQSGVEKGIAKGGNPIEVMGMLLGRPDTLNTEALVVTDAFPLPIEGFETRVVADDENVTNHMISLMESLEKTRKERFMGWYHSHPFDLADRSHCFLSQTDLSTQLQWQRSEDPHGNPFVAIVVDPLRSTHLRMPELKAFRAYPPEYNSPVANECPNGVVEALEQTRLEHWGSCWNRYYELSIDYYMSSTSRVILEQLTQDNLWIRNLMKQPVNENKQDILAASRLFKSAQETSRTALSVGSTGSGSMPPSRRATRSSSVTRNKDWGKAMDQLAEAATAQICNMTLKHTKKHIFSS